MDRVKEALFNIIGRDIINAVFLDLFAGTGSVGIEALSRGARQALFVDIERAAIQTIHDNLDATRLSEKAVVRRGDAFAILKQPPSQPFDFIYVAPPQYKGLWLGSLQALDQNPVWIPPGTSVIVQIDPSEERPVSLTHLEMVDNRRYGNTLLWFFAAHEGQSGGDMPQEKST